MTPNYNNNAPRNDVFGNISFDFMQNMIFNRSSIFYQNVMFCNKYNGILPFLPPRSSLFATFSGRFFSILLGGWSFNATGKAFRVFHVFHLKFLLVKYELCFFYKGRKHLKKTRFFRSHAEISIAFRSRVTFWKKIYKNFERY